MLAWMQEELRQLAELAAHEATAQLGALAFGAIDRVVLADVEAGTDEGVDYFTVSWSVVSMGIEDSRVRMVILPEFFDDDPEGDALVEQMAAYVVDRVLEEAQAE